MPYINGKSKLYMVRPRVIYNIEIDDNFYYMHFRLNLRNKTVDYLCVPILLFFFIILIWLFFPAYFFAIGLFDGFQFPIQWIHTQNYPHNNFLVLLVAWHCKRKRAQFLFYIFACLFSSISFWHSNSLSSCADNWYECKMHCTNIIILSTLNALTLAWALCLLNKWRKKQED